MGNKNSDIDPNNDTIVIAIDGEALRFRNLERDARQPPKKFRIQNRIEPIMWDEFYHTLNKCQTFDDTKQMRRSRSIRVWLVRISWILLIGAVLWLVIGIPTGNAADRKAKTNINSGKAVWITSAIFGTLWIIFGFILGCWASRSKQRISQNYIEKVHNQLAVELYKLNLKYHKLIHFVRFQGNPIWIDITILADYVSYIHVIQQPVPLASQHSIATIITQQSNAAAEMNQMMSVENPQQNGDTLGLLPNRIDMQASAPSFVPQQNEKVIGIGTNIRRELQNSKYEKIIPSAPIQMELMEVMQQYDYNKNSGNKLQIETGQIEGE